MATRLYLPSLRGTNDQEPMYQAIPFSASWDNTASAVRHRFEESAIFNSGSNTITITKSLAGPKNWLAVQFQLPGLRAQTISGNLKGQCRFAEGNVAADASVQTVARVWIPSTNTFRGTLLAAHTSGANGVAGTEGYELAAVATNRKMPSGWSGTGKALTSLAVEDNDVLVIEVGFKVDENNITNRNQTMSISQINNGTDAPEDETDTSATNSWFEFSNTLSLGLLTELGGEMAKNIPQVGQVWPRGSRGV